MKQTRRGRLNATDRALGLTRERVADETFRLQVIALGNQEIVQRRQSRILQRDAGDPLQGLDDLGLFHLSKVFHTQSYYLLLPVLQYDG